MTRLDPRAAYAERTAPDTLVFRRRLPATAAKIWPYLIESDLRKQWLASGMLEPVAGTSCELVWRNDELSASASERPDGFAEESRATWLVTEVEPLCRLAITWPGVGDVTFELEPAGDETVLTVTHRRLDDRAMTLMVGPGWHAHLDILAARIEGIAAGSFWSSWVRLREEYERLLPA